MHHACEVLFETVQVQGSNPYWTTPQFGNRTWLLSVRTQFRTNKMALNDRLLDTSYLN
jgi:hypothetical protein